MSYLVDTNVVAELCRRAPNPRVLSRVRDIPDTLLHLSVVTVGELRTGVESLTDARRKERLRGWLENDPANWFGERLVPVTAAVAGRWGRLPAQAGRAVPPVDGFLAATALHHGLRVVTRDSQDVALPGLEVVNPRDHRR